MAKKIRKNKVKRPVGKPTKFTKELRAALVKLTERYYYYHITAARANISPLTFETYRKKDRVFNDDVMRARVVYLARTVDMADMTGKKDWRFHFHKLAVSDPEHFSEKRRVELTGKNTFNVVYSYRKKK